MDISQAVTEQNTEYTTISQSINSLQLTEINFTKRMPKTGKLTKICTFGW